MSDTAEYQNGNDQPMPFRLAKAWCSQWPDKLALDLAPDMIMTCEGYIWEVNSVILTEQCTFYETERVGYEVEMRRGTGKKYVYKEEGYYSMGPGRLDARIQLIYTGYIKDLRQCYGEETLMCTIANVWKDGQFYDCLVMKRYAYAAIKWAMSLWIAEYQKRLPEKKPTNDLLSHLLDALEVMFEPKEPDDFETSEEEMREVFQRGTHLALEELVGHRRFQKLLCKSPLLGKYIGPMEVLAPPFPPEKPDLDPQE
ncbi:hypothetical protein BD289DRAFT_486649 [Coniella lustricola]|uniref:Uncharacterized protein n=1 Tax=Coniella lustricola TaxID=2025994 RepID=A0A2T2ZUG6_9PEZI|nr:hypothetical protein BD289DRAFT_486649 [Coniella lustricola]